MQDSPRPQFEILLMKAHSDLAIAMNALQSEDEEIDDEAILFHLHQATEKYLKALLAKNGVHFDKNHDVSYLIDLCRDSQVSVPDFADSLIALNPYAVQGRYEILGSIPDEMPEFFQMVRALKGYVLSSLAPNNEN